MRTDGLNALLEGLSAETRQLVVATAALMG